MSVRSRTKLATGIYRDAHGVSIVTWRHGEQSEHRVPLNVYTLAELKTLRADLVYLSRKESTHAARGTFAADVAQHLDAIAGRIAPTTMKSKRSELAAWLPTLGPMRRDKITRAHVERAMASWLEPVDRPARRVRGRLVKPRPWTSPSAKTIKNRVIALRAVFHALDGPKASTPADRLDLPRPMRQRPRGVDVATIRRTLARLIRAERAGHLRDAKTRARFMVLVSTGQRPVQVARTTPADVDIDGRVWYVPNAKHGESVELPLNDDMLASWRLFISADAFGPYDSRSFVRTIRRAGWPADVRPYAARHAVGIALSRSGVDLGDIQPFLGHARIETTRRHYVPGLLDRLRAAGERIDHRLDVSPRVLKFAGRMESHMEVRAQDVDRAKVTRKAR